MLNEVIYLVTQKEPVYDEDGFIKTKAEEIKTKVFADVKSINYKEYYEASRNGEKVTDVFVIDERDYNNAIIKEDGKKVKPTLVQYDDVMYRIIRRYKKGSTGNFVIELSCEEVE